LFERAAVDPELLTRLAETSVHVGEQAHIHNRAEVVGSVPGLMDTLATSDPYAYMLMPDFQPDGSIRLHPTNAHDDVAALYEVVRGRSDVLAEDPLVELRTPWYAFWETLSTGRRKDSTAVHEHPLAVLSPAGPQPGITGEIIWARMPWSMLGTGEDTSTDADPFGLRRDLRHRHMRMLDALAAGDVEALLAEHDPGCSTVTRDYVGGTELLVEVVGIDGLRTFHEELLARYEIDSVELIHRVAQDWYVFAEVRVTARERGDGGAKVAFHTATIHAPGRDGRIVASLGWGTEPVALG